MKMELTDVGGACLVFAFRVCDVCEVFVVIDQLFVVCDITSVS